MTTPEPDNISATESSGAFMPAHLVSQRCLALLFELEDSLRLSQAALLATKADRTESCTREQVRLCRELKALVIPSSSGTFPALEESRPDFRQVAPEAAAQLIAAAMRVQHLARVQAALLRRSQRFLCVLANWMKGAEAGYGPPRNFYRDPAERKTDRPVAKTHKDF